MNKRFSEMGEQELKDQMKHFEAEIVRLENTDNQSQVEILEQKLLVARSYQLNQADFKTGRIYNLENSDTYAFKLNYINGVFAWGNKINNETKKENREEALPLALLKSEVSK